MMMAQRWLASLILLIFAASCARGAAPIVGTVKTTEGGAAVRRGGQSTPCAEGMHLMSHDVLTTSANGRLGIILQDGTRISLGPNTGLSIDEFLFEPVGGRFSLLLRLARGVLAYVSGSIGRLAPGSVRIETPVATVGHRGTSFAVSIEGP